MSYCRFSTDSFRCDLYVYETESPDDDPRFTIHVAGNRIPEDAPRLPELTAKSIEDYVAAYRELTDYLLSCPRTPIDAPYAGETLLIGSLEELRAKLIELRDLGYRFPDAVLDAVDAEIAESAPAGK
ncbi:hypothetical protein CKO28_00670 [Rhodovibrio sodomensis]|uniref:Uncharacterized protein n=1 Tax=Rhodovibrio sodomensis TaxID=1088 RepID=A0ABS1D8I6_9PROT|nr:hypothetical protein [Rhodovibrio sodomensis]MBK1666554.1 hypothetical protein [Rhodovibrio sodomensis]